ncbi:MAG: chitobiase/beta-hexosaminidase C-terminal domain-containing protein, partial [Gammaproteobacteria bacterium]|nr:chitobiase/beta-hexosaminidase C-terminal domain-containing protein [Gammaproteobacteria bacterium]
TLSYFSVDLAGNAGAVQSQTYSVTLTTLTDTTAPSTTPSWLGGAYNSTKSIALSCDDGAGSGCDKTYYSVDGSVPTSASLLYSAPIVVGAGTTTLSYFSVDLAGNAGAVQSQVYVVSLAGVAVTVVAKNKELQFSWSAIVGTDHYRILENPDGVSGFNVIANNIKVNSYQRPISVHKINWLAAQYQVEACDAAETNCIGSVSYSLALIDSIAATLYLKASNTGVGDWYGHSVDLSGDGNTLAVGAPSEASSATGINGNQLNDNRAVAGAVYIYSRDLVTNTWSQQAYIKASNAGAHFHFGVAVELSDDGSTLAVGADDETSDNVVVGSGAAYLFVRSANNIWSEQAYLRASNAAVGDQFSRSISLSGDGNTLAVSAQREDSSAMGLRISGSQLDLTAQADNAATEAGAVYLFTRVASVWSQQVYLKASNTGSGDWFGSAVALSGDGNTLAVGAMKEDSAATGVNGSETNNASLNAGAMYLFTRSTVNGSWSQQAYLKASNTAKFDTLGASVSISSDGNTVAVSALGEDSAATGVNGDQLDNLAPGAGAIYLFNRSASVWSQQAYIKASNTNERDEFGFSLSLSSDGNTLAVGAFGEDSLAKGIDGDQANNGAVDLIGTSAAYLLSRDVNNVWSHRAYIKASNTEFKDLFGFALSLSSDGATLAVGARWEDSVANGV